MCVGWTEDIICAAFGTNTIGLHAFLLAIVHMNYANCDRQRKRWCLLFVLYQHKHLNFTEKKVISNKIISFLFNLLLKNCDI